jgi:hypothetical protein
VRLVQGLGGVLLGRHARVRARRGQVGKRGHDRAVQRGLITLEGEHIVRALLLQLGGDGRLAADGVDGDDTVLQREQPQQAGERRALVPEFITVQACGTQWGLNRYIRGTDTEVP